MPLWFGDLPASGTTYPDLISFWTRRPGRISGFLFSEKGSRPYYIKLSPSGSSPFDLSEGWHFIYLFYFHSRASIPTREERSSETGTERIAAELGAFCGDTNKYVCPLPNPYQGGTNWPTDRIKLKCESHIFVYICKSQAGSYNLVQFPFASKCKERSPRLILKWKWGTTICLRTGLRNEMEVFEPVSPPKHYGFWSNWRRVNREATKAGRLYFSSSSPSAGFLLFATRSPHEA